MTPLFRLIVILLSPLLLTGCLLTPGEFESDLTIDADGGFNFAYRGEIILYSQSGFMSNELNSSGQGSDGLCYDDETNESVPCTEEFLAERRQRNNEFDGELIAAMGGLNPHDEETMNAFANQLSRERGWHSVEYRGHGIFYVDYSISGELDRSFVFPVYPEFDFIIPFITITRRSNGAVHVRAPAFSRGHGSNTPGAPTGYSRADGTFVIRSNGAVLTNNTEDGPTRENGMTVMRWTVNALTTSRPETLIQLED